MLLHIVNWWFVVKSNTLHPQITYHIPCKKKITFFLKTTHIQSSKNCKKQELPVPLLCNTPKTKKRNQLNFN